MTLTIDKQIVVLFKILDSKHGNRSFPSAGMLADILRKKIEKSGKISDEGEQKTMLPEESALFASAAVEMWLRSVHSYLISAALLNTSPVWASVSGYYSSHYCVRGIAHLLGFFQIRRPRRHNIKVHITSGKHYCLFYSKNADDREHKFYWKTVKNDFNFLNNKFFTMNPEDQDESDESHRVKANYFDHIDHFSSFNPLNSQALIDRLTYISKFRLTSVPIPRRNEFPDIENVQLIAYHRIIYFRRFLDEILGDKSSYWNFYRNPSWCKGYLNFQVVQPSFLEE